MKGSMIGSKLICEIKKECRVVRDVHLPFTPLSDDIVILLSYKWWGCLWPWPTEYLRERTKAKAQKAADKVLEGMGHTVRIL